jgi:Uma2 family endonuclease
MHAIDLSDLPHYTYNDYKLWEGKWELIYGIPYAMSPSPNFKHQKISNKIARILDQQLENCQLCTALLPFDWKIAEDTVVQPDNMVICHEPENETFLNQAPEIIFEILSKSTAHKDRHTKFKLYEKNAVNYYIIIDPEKNKATIFQLIKNSYTQMAEIKNENFYFELENCRFDFDFSQIWQ